jgi:hypothetical protein
MNLGDLGDLLGNLENASNAELFEGLGVAMTANKGAAAMKIKNQMNSRVKSGKMAFEPVSQAGSQSNGARGQQPRSSREEFMHYAKLIQDKTIHDLIENENFMVIASGIYSIKLLTSAGGDIFHSGDSKIEGVTNLNAAKLDANTALLLKAIRLQTGVGAAPTEIAGKSVVFGTPVDLILNGSFTFKVQTKTFWDKSPCGVFKGAANERSGLWILDTPIMINPQRDLSFAVASSESLVANTFAKVELLGLYGSVK